MKVNIKNNNLERRRDRLHIIAEILQVTLVDGALKTQVMYKANLSFAQLNQYLLFLLDLDLLELKKRSEKEVYKTTPKGISFLESYEQIQKLLKKTNENISSNGINSKNGNNSVFLVTRRNHVVCKEAH